MLAVGPTFRRVETALLPDAAEVDGHNVFAFACDLLHVSVTTSIVKVVV